MGAERLRTLIVCHIHKEILNKILLDDILKIFIVNNKQRVDFYSIIA